MNNELSVKKPLLQSFTLIGSLTTVLLVIIGIVFYGSREKVWGLSKKFM